MTFSGKAAAFLALEFCRGSHPTEAHSERFGEYCTSIQALTGSYMAFNTFIASS